MGRSGRIARGSESGTRNVVDLSVTTRVNRPKNWLHDKGSFFKYMAPDGAVKVLNNRSLRWSSPASFNDPFDLRFDLQADINHAKVRELTLKALWDAHYSLEGIPVGNDFGQLIRACRTAFPKLTREQFDREFGEAVDESLRKLRTLVDESNLTFQTAMRDTKVLCLTERPDSILMWSHYAQMHQGVVFELACVPERDSAWGAALPVRYGDMPKIYDDEFLVGLLSGQVSMTTADFIDESVNRFVTAKAADWSYEDEWRVVLHRTDISRPTEFFSFSPEELAAVYMGCRMPQNCRDEIAMKIRRDYPRTRILVAEKMKRKFALDFREY